MHQFSTALSKRATIVMVLAMLLLSAALAQNRSEAAAPAERVDQAWQDFQPRYQPVICPFAGKADYDEDIISCGYVLVPEDRTDPSSRLIRLAVMRVASTQKNPPAGTVVRLDGGPGGPSISSQRAAYYSGPESLPFREAFETIFFDQRGIGYSDPPFCRAVPEAYQYGVRMTGEGERRYIEEMRRCFAEARQQGIAIDAYSTWQNALDVRDLRRALGHERWNIFGISYGTELGQAVLQVDPDGVRAAVLDSVIPIFRGGATGWLAMGPNFGASLDSLGSACAGHKACAEDVGNMRDRFVKAIAAYGERPLVLDDLPLNRFQGGRVVADDALVANMVFQLLYNNLLYNDLPILLDVLERRDAEAIRAYAKVAGNGLNHQFGVGMRLSTICRGASKTTPEIRAAVRTREPELAAWFEPIDFSLACEALYSGTDDPSVMITRTAVPVLIAAGAADPITPPFYSQSIRPGMPNSSYVEFPYTGHSALFSSGDCGRSILIGFLLNPNAKVNTSCIGDLDGPDFLTDWRATPNAYRFVSGVQEGARPVMPALIFLGLLAGLIAYPLAFAGRQIDRRAFQADRPFLVWPRLFSWLAVLMMLAATGLAAWMIFNWIKDHPLALPVGLPTEIAFVGWLALAAVIVALIALVQTFQARKTKSVPLGTILGAMFVAVLTFSGLLFLWSLGAGPI